MLFKLKPLVISLLAAQGIIIPVILQKMTTEWGCFACATAAPNP